MDDQNRWKDWKPVDEELNRMLRPGFSRRLNPNHPLEKLKVNLVINMAWGLLITLAYLVIILVYPIWPVVLALLITSAFNVIVLKGAMNLYRSIRTTISGEVSLLESLKKHHADIEAWGRLQLKMAIWVYPFATAGGYILGGTIGSGKSLDQLMQQQSFVWVLPLAILVFVPVGYLVARWMFKKAFGRHLAALELTIKALENGE